MDDDVIDKFVANMRASGQSDDMIAQSLLSAGHSELIVLNALGVEHMSQLSGDDDDEEDDAPQEPLRVPSAYTVVDSNGNPIISQDNLPKAVGETASEPTPAAPAIGTVVKPKTDRTRIPAKRAYPRPTLRSASSPTQPKPSGFIHHSTTGVTSHVPKKPEVTPPPTRKPLAMPSTPAPRPELVKKINENKKISEYGHHTFDDFMGRIEAHKELEPSHESELESGVSKEATTPKTIDVVATKTTDEPAQPMGPQSIDALLDEQKMEASEGPSGPEMDDLLDAKDLEALQKHPDVAPPPKPVDLKNIPQVPQVARAGGLAHDIRSSLALKITLIVMGVMILIALAYSVSQKITG